MNKRRIIIFVVIILLITMICYPKKITIRIGIFAGSNWDVPNGDCYQIIDDAIQIFEDKYPLVNVEYESGILKEDYSNWLSELYLKGEEPDVFMVLSEDFNTLSSLGALKNLESFMQKDKDFSVDHYYENSLQAGIYQDKQYALPYESNPTLMFVNKTLLDNENIDIPSNDWTLDDFYEICQKVSQDTNNDGYIDQFGCYNFTWLDSVYCHGVSLFDEEGTNCYLNDAGIKDAITFVQKLNTLNQGHTITATEFDKGSVAFMPMPFSQYRTYMPYPWRVKKYFSFEWDCVKMPSLIGKTQTTEMSTLLMGISSRSSHLKESWEFLKLLTYNEDVQKQLFQYSQGISPLKSVVQSSEALSLLGDDILLNSQVDMGLLNEIMENTLNHSQFKKYESTLSLIDKNITDIIFNEEDIDLSLMSLQREINQYLNE